MKSELLAFSSQLLIAGAGSGGVGTNKLKADG